MTIQNDDHWIDRAVELAAGTQGPPYSGVIVQDGAFLGEGVNEMPAGDPTAHGEMQAIRNVARTHGSAALKGATLYASGEPCPMCLTAAAAVGITRVIYAATADEAAEAGDDYGASIGFHRPIQDWIGQHFTVEHHPHPAAASVFRRS